MENFGLMKNMTWFTILYFFWYDKLYNVLVKEVNAVLTDTEFMVITYQLHCLTPPLVLKFCTNLVKAMKE